MHKASDNSTPRFTWRQRIALWWIAFVGTIAVRVLGSTLRVSYSAEDNADARTLPEAKAVVPFWHRAVLMSTYLFRDRGIAVMTSRSFDGEYIARIISNFGYVPVRGSSSRGAVRALLGMHTAIEEGRVAAFTIDGPRGPALIAKPGPVLLARHSGVPIRALYVAVDRYWTVNSWDNMIIPKPFANAHVRWGRPINVAPDADLDAMHKTMQQSLEEVTRYAEEVVARRQTSDVGRQ